MGKWAGLCAMTIVTLTLAGTELQTLSATPENAPALPGVVDLWIAGDDFSDGNLAPRPCEEAIYSPAIAYWYAPDLPPEGIGGVRYFFTLPEAQTLKLFAALGHQGTVYVSPVEFRLDQDAWQPVTPSPLGRKAYGLSMALGWERLGEFPLTAGEHTLELRFREPTGLGGFSFLCDGIAGIRSDLPGAAVDALACPPVATPGEAFELSWRQEKPALLEAVLLYRNGEEILSQFLAAAAGENHCRLALPRVLGGGEYTVALRPAGEPETILARTAFTIPPQYEPTPATILLDAAWDGAEWRLEVEAPAGGRVVIWYFSDGVLYGAQSVAIPPGVRNLSGTLSSELSRLIRGRPGELRFLAADGKGEKSLAIAPDGEAAPLPLPMNYGVFEDASGRRHPWYMAHDSSYIFDGERFVPFGAMWCPDTTALYQPDSAAVEAAFERDRAVLDAVNAHGLRDSYLNMAGAPIWVRQFFLDQLDQRRQTYGYQLTSTEPKVPAFFLTRDRDGADGTWQGVIRGAYRDGQVTAQMPRTYEVLALAVLPTDPGAGWSRFFHFADREGLDTRSAIIDLEEVQAFDDLRQVAFSADLPLAEGAEVLLVPFLNANMAHADLWNPAVMARLKEAWSWIGDVDWGPGLRFFIDPVTNEGNMLNTTEPLRQYTPELNAAFAAWLKERYGDAAALSRAWDVALGDFETASRLIPQRLGEEVLLFDPESGRVWRARVDRTLSWADFCDMIRESYADKIDEVAGYLKSLVDVPVICKSVGVIAEKMNVSRRYLGSDGIGFEIYLANGREPGETGGGAARGEAELSRHTMWKVGTEIGHDPAVGNGGVKFFTDEEEVRTVTDKLIRLGVAGFYYFGWTLKPGEMWDNHNYQDFPDGLRWIERIKREYLDGTFRPEESPRYFAFPNGNSWWWWSTRYFAVYGVEPNTLSQGARLDPESDDWFVSSSELPPTFDAVLLNCPDPPFAARFAPEITRAVRQREKPVYYLGSRRDLGAIPELDRYFTAETIRFDDGSQAQVLRPDGAEVLAAENGRPWALRRDNLIIVSRVPEITSKVINADDYVRYLVEILARADDR